MDIMPYLAKTAYSGGRGVCQLDALGLDSETIQRIEQKCPNARAVAVVLFPYLVRDKGNLSLYARGRDYHTVIAQLLAPVVRELQQDFPENRFVPLIDASPLPEVRAAWLSGAGILGCNGLLFDRDYGSFVFIGTILTDLDATATPTEQARCPACGACRRACPAGALGENGMVEESRCLSALTQSKAVLTEQQKTLLQAHPLIWGCDSCSLVCPLNRDAKETENPAFRTDRLVCLTEEQIDGLTRKQFLAAFPDRAFTWRGPAPLVRNLMLKQQK